MPLSWLVKYALLPGTLPGELVDCVPQLTPLVQKSLVVLAVFVHV